MSESVKNSDFGITLLPSSFSLNENWPTLERGPTNVDGILHNLQYLHFSRFMFIKIQPVAIDI